MMNRLALLALLVAAPTFAAVEYGGVKFHSTVEKSQVRSLKNDLRYLYKSSAEKPDTKFLTYTQMQVGDGPNMHNWLLNRVRYIYGEKADFGEKNLIAIDGRFPKTPLPDIPEPPKKILNKEEPEELGVTVMSNLASYYLMGKMYNLFIGFDFDGEKVFVKSPRTGLLKVGRGLFLKEFRINKENVDHPSNSVSRLATLFHEARHSDGNGKSLLFMHDFCPADHYFAGAPACDRSGNGPYTIGGLAQKHLIQKCTTCSVAEKTALTAGVADSFGRVLLTVKNRDAEYKQMIAIYTQIIRGYEKLSNETKSEANKAYYRREIKKLKDVIAATEAEKKSRKDLVWPEDRNGAPEGEWTPVSLQESKKLMEKSLK